MSLTEAQITSAIRMYQQGATAGQIGESLGRSDQAIYQLLERRGIPRRPRGATAIYNADKVLACWNRLRNNHAVSRKMGISLSQVCRIVQAAGLNVGKGGNSPPKIQFDEDLAARKYAAGLSCRQIGDLLGIDDEVIRKRLRKRGIRRRKRGEYERRGADNKQWKGGIDRKHKSDPKMHYHRRQSYEVAAICLGQPLPLGSIIHHRNEDWTDNRWENLVIFPSQSAHARYHRQLLTLQRIGSEVDAIRLESENGGRPLPQPPAPIVLPPYTNQHGPSKRATQKPADQTASEPALAW